MPLYGADAIAVGLTNPSRGVVDFDDWRALKPMYDAASEAGLFVVLRPGKSLTRLACLERRSLGMEQALM